MKKVLWSGAVAAVLAVVLVPAPAHAQVKLEGKAFDSAYVKDFYLEGNAIPTQKRNTVILKAADGTRLVFGLLDGQQWLLFAAAHTEKRYSASTIAPTTHGVASPITRFVASSTQYSTPMTTIVPEMPIRRSGCLSRTAASGSSSCANRVGVRPIWAR